MPLFMDVHDHVDGLTAEAVSGAHALPPFLAREYTHSEHFCAKNARGVRDSWGGGTTGVES